MSEWAIWSYRHFFELYTFLQISESSFIDLCKTLSKSTVLVKITVYGRVWTICHRFVDSKKKYRHRTSELLQFTIIALSSIFRVTIIESFSSSVLPAKQWHRLSMPVTWVTWAQINNINNNNRYTVMVGVVFYSNEVVPGPFISKLEMK